MIVASISGADGEGGRPHHGSKFTMNLVVDLPHDVSAAILNSWLPLPDIARFDSAMCINDKRGIMLELLSSGGVFRCITTSCDLGQKVILTTNYLAWIYSRGIKVDGIEAICSELEFDLLLQYLRKCDSSVGHFCFSLKPPVPNNHSIPAGLEDALRHLPNCKDVSLSGLTLDTAGARAVAKGLASVTLLTRLELSHNHTRGSDVWGAIATVVPSMSQLTMYKSRRC